jgi:hypothetical protein
MYPKFRIRSSADGSTTSYFYIKSADLIGKLKANATEYIFNGQYTEQTESELIATSKEMAPQDWATVAEDNATISERVGSHPIIIAH